ncbi:hypothetical protein DUGA6_04040 [Duganella sp. HH105]|nr:hypothetical protein DUGA6_04040 [Duganella sp. HH105]OFA06945.1 hypothetical protein DUGA2_02770 [Duganella sp. HH101]
MNNPLFTPDPADFHRQIKSFSFVRNRKNPLSNIWFFDSPKNDKRLLLTTDPVFMHVVLLEGDLSVTGYAVTDFNAESAEDLVRPTMRVYYQDKRVEWWLVKWSDKSRGATASAMADQHGVLQEHAKACGAALYIKTEKDLRGKEIVFDNWLNLCAAITRCRSISTATEAMALKEAFQSQDALRYGELVALPGVDPAHMLALVAQALQRGALNVDLESELFGPQSVLRRAYI